MIHHVSIPAKDPKHVADVLAELMNGRAYPFPGNIANSFMAVSGDAHGTMIEVYPETLALTAGTADDEQVKASQATAPAAYPFHVLLSVPVDRAAVQRIGDREGWRTKVFGRGAPGKPPVFHIFEFWIENHLMLEVATPDMLAAYAETIQPARLDALFGQRAAA
ncbi:MAG TPA: hypothetical protein VFE41_25535 [Acetobacteraceae bacterium]|jgi:hypothetical protein|nr:hypothetical protein [Acetobacteraceae bacterium]